MDMRATRPRRFRRWSPVISSVDAEVAAMATRRVEQRMHNVHAERHPQQKPEQNGAALAPKPAAFDRATHPDHLLAGRSRPNHRPSQCAAAQRLCVADTFTRHAGGRPSEQHTLPTVAFGPASATPAMATADRVERPELQFTAPALTACNTASSSPCKPPMCALPGSHGGQAGRATGHADSTFRYPCPITFATALRSTACERGLARKSAAPFAKRP